MRRSGRNRRRRRSPRRSRQPLEPTLEEPAAVEPLPEESGHGRIKRNRKASVEDEWGFFDPDRAGFAALLAKLEEITEDDSAKTQRT
jgi:hypothetical protein